MKKDVFDEPHYLRSQSELEEEAQKLKQKIKRLKIVPLVLLVITVMMHVVSVIAADKAPLKTPATFDSKSAPGDYVSVALLYATPAYTEYSTDTTTKKQSVTATYYLAIDEDYQIFIIKCDEDYFEEHLAVLEENLEKDDAQTVTIYADVRALNDQIKEDPIEIPGFPAVNNTIQLNVLDGPAKEARVDLFGIAVLFGVATFISGLVWLGKRGKYKNKLQNLEDYGDVDAIYDQVYANRKYEDDALISDGTYIISRNKKQIVETAEALSLYQYVHRTNLVTDTVALVVVNKYGETKQFGYKLNQKDKVLEAVIMLSTFCPNAVPGYTAESMQYVQMKKVKREKKKESKKELD